MPKPPTFLIAVRTAAGSRAIARIIPYSPNSGGFAVTVPHHHGDTEIALVDMSLVIPLPEIGTVSKGMYLSAGMFRRSMVLKHAVKLSVHPSGFVQFSPADRNSFLSGVHRSPIRAAKGFGMWWLPREWESQPGPSFQVAITEPKSFPVPVASGHRVVELFEDPPTEGENRMDLIANRHRDWISSGDQIDHSDTQTLIVEGYAMPRSKLVEAELLNGRLVLHHQPPHWPTRRHLRILDWGDPTGVVGIHLTRRTFGRNNPSFTISGPIDKTGLLQLVASSPPLVR